MKRRVCVNRTEKEKLALLRRWKVDNPDWTLEEAAVEHEVKESTLRGWVKRYWDVCDEEVGSDRKRNEGGGRKHKMKPYEWRVIEYLDELMEDNWTFDDQNSVDCGIYLLYFIEKISTAIMKDRPHTPRGSMDKLCSDKFNVENYRALLHQRIIRAANVANKKSKIL
ncbi:hypothetical protein PHYSODRAFT_533938 [Phytophthora sojae]|uniref:Uncharacterized protein n=1 Tax=Phytophthora sojae (strain P6497) TaxID=1094619 RepID=G5AFU5_PHYSP|nr:hypothetical protein PHYSODRAFT_533938 [Phytophthora sojae]EGZ05461.1 hypothetical protein PHYSODRAFT_533938 [Phytophthora sojae]|eukprot:XP_009538992.1 hypothetical protein PHYSODRAFT_533938 [Phytophthora sojae]